MLRAEGRTYSKRHPLQLTICVHRRRLRLSEENRSIDYNRAMRSKSRRMMPRAAGAQFCIVALKYVRPTSTIPNSRGKK
jgi:hypothetical protein